MPDITEARNNPDLPEGKYKKIAQIYRAQIRVPDKKPERQFILCPVGMVGSGKTTVVKPLAEKFDLVRVSNDEIRKVLKDRGYSFNGAKEISIMLIDDFIKSGYSVAIDSNCASEFTRSKIKEAVEKHGVKAIWIRINPPEEFIINKLKNYPHTWLFKDGEEAVRAYLYYKENHGDYMKAKLPFIYTFDTSRSDLPEQITEAEQLISKALKN